LIERDRNFHPFFLFSLTGCFCPAGHPGAWGCTMGQELSWPYKVVPEPIVSVFLQKTLNNTHLFIKENFASVTYHFTAT
jgi:hypothetical protein